MTLKQGEVFSDTPLTDEDKAFVEIIKEHNKTHTVCETELTSLLKQASTVYHENFDGSVWFERSIFTNWTCGIADCRYCYLSTKPKLDKSAVRQKSSILAESLICRLMGWKVGYITGGLRVEKTEYMVELLQNLAAVLGYKPRMNYGPYSQRELESFKDHVSGLGCAIESFDERLHAFICPSKPLPALLRFLSDCQKKDIPNFITIILGIGEKKDDVYEVIEKITHYNIDTVQLCFLKPQEKTVFTDLPPPNISYMAWWCAKLRIAHPKLILKIALVQDRISDFSMLLQAGANSFSRYFVFSDFASQFADELIQACQKAGRTLQGNFTQIPQMDIRKEVDLLPFCEELKKEIYTKTLRYKLRLERLVQKNT